MRLRIAMILLSVLAAIEAAASMQAPPPGQIPAAPIPAVTSGLTAEQQTTLAGVYFPTSVAFDSAGNLYIAEAYSARIRKVTPAGAATFIAGTGTPGFDGDGGPAAAAQLRNPFDIAVDAAGNLYIADAGNSRIRKVSANGVISTVAGNGIPGFSGDGGPAAKAQLNNPRGIALDAAGNLYISDTGNVRIRKVTATGSISTIAGAGNAVPGNPANLGDGGPATEARLRTPYGIAVDATGNLYFAEMGASRVRKIADGKITTVAGTGTRGFSGDGGLATAAQLNNPLGVALDAAGNIYISDPGAARIRQVAADGTIATFSGTGAHGSTGDSGPAATAQLDTPLRAVAGPLNSMYIVDPGAQRIRVISQGQIRAVTGSGRIANPTNPRSVPMLLVDPGTIERVGGPVSAPSCKPMEPNYAEDARLAGYGGTVILNALISKDGSVQALGVPHPLGFGLDERAIAVLDRWKCTPSMRDGMPVNVQLTIQINFHLY